MANLIFKIKRRIFQKILFFKPLSYWQKYGINVTRNNYYSNIPDLNTLSESAFTRKSDLIGIDINEAEQIALFKLFVSKYKTEYDAWPLKSENYFDFNISQTSFRSVDSQILHCMIRHFKPAQVIEVGSGYSTMITAKALLCNEKENSKSFNFTAIEPYPNENLKKGIPGLTSIIDKFIQDVDLSVFNKLKENDVLFLDSTHTVKIDGDVNYEILELLPRLNKGVIVHIHDIFLPYEYPESWIRSGERIWLEQYLLQAFLCNNNSYKILWMSHYMHQDHSDLLKENLKYYEVGVPFKGSIWIQKIV
jgi:predicted O-methyltransferase YrrM